MASELPDDLQDQLAQELLEEIGWEWRWDDTLAGSQEKLEKLAEKAEHENGVLTLDIWPNPRLKSDALKRAA